MTNTRNALSNGAIVLTSDGAELGRVDIAEPQAFKVNAPMQPDYWLANATLMAIANGQAVVGFEEEHLDEFKAGSAAEAGRVKATQVLVQMHGEAKALFRAILATMDPATARQLWGGLQPALEVHEQMEERHLYHPLQEELGADDANGLGRYGAEHHAEVQALQAMIARVNALDAGSREWAQSVTQIRDTLEEHMAEEEQDIFPRVRNHWNDARLAEAGTAMLQMKISRLGPPVASAA